MSFNANINFNNQEEESSISYSESSESRKGAPILISKSTLKRVDKMSNRQKGDKDNDQSSNNDEQSSKMSHLIRIMSMKKRNSRGNLNNLKIIEDSYTGSPTA